MEILQTVDKYDNCAWKVLSLNCCLFLGQYDNYDHYRIMKKIELRKVKKNDFFRLTNSECAPLWVRDDYDRSTKKYEVYKYDDVNHWSECKGTRIVFV